jgi:23S rRNA (cytosine1962-C5)-methyltransferase
MKPLRLRDREITVLFENDDIVAIDKPYGISSHTNESKVGNEDYIQQGLIEFFEIQLKRKLHIVHRLDRTTTGVIVFAKTIEAARRYQAYFRLRETRKTYWFVTDSEASATHRSSELYSNQPIVYKGSELEAETNFLRITQSSRFALWQANPRTGRNHQIRIHAAGLGIPILGDIEYGGTKFPFICLHNKQIRFPIEGSDQVLTIEAGAPVYFGSFELLENEELAELLSQIDRRKRIFAKSASQLLLAPNLEQYGSRLVLTTSDVSISSQAKILASTERREIIMQSNSSWSQANQKSFETQWLVSEGKMKFELRLGPSTFVGLFVDQRLLRQWVFENSKGRSVLILFGGNGTVGVAAGCGEAKSVFSVDARKSSIEWAKRNAEINHLSPDRLKFYCRDPIRFLGQMQTQQNRFDLIVCEAPSFFRREKSEFRIETDLEALVRDCLSRLTDAGQLLLSLSSRVLKVDDVRKVIESAARGAAVGEVEIFHVLPSLDIALPGEMPQFKSFLVQRS